MICMLHFSNLALRLLQQRQPGTLGFLLALLNLQHSNEQQKLSC